MSSPGLVQVQNSCDDNMVEDFIYTEDIENINPMTLNLTLTSRDEHRVMGELRKKFTIDLNHPEQWVELFSSSLEGKPIKANVIITFRNSFTSACKLKELGLLKPGTKVKLD